MNMTKKGALFVIEGIDGSGKATQTDLLYQYLQQSLLTDSRMVHKISFPDYDSPSSSLVKMYLNGDFGQDPNAVNAFAASILFAVDRFASFRTSWQSQYAQGDIILADRYTTSNMIHQAGKLSNLSEKQQFLDWLADLEYRIFALPRPTAVFFLDMPPVCSLMLRQKRNALKPDLHQDIHEKNEAYLLKAYENAITIAQHQNWQIISCVKDQKIRSIEDIHQEIVQQIETLACL